MFAEVAAATGEQAIRDGVARTVLTRAELKSAALNRISRSRDMNACLLQHGLL